MSTPDPAGAAPRAPWPALVATFAAPVLLGLVVGLTREASLLGALVLLAEPLLLGVGLYGLFALLLGGRWAASGALLAGLILGGGLLHLPATPAGLAEREPSWAAGLQECVREREPLDTPLRILSWRVDEEEPLPVDQIREEDPDVVVVHGVGRATALDDLALAMQGEARYLPGPHGGLGLVVRGMFRYCGGQTDRWELTLADPDHPEGSHPSGQHSDARLVVTLPELDGAGGFALVAAVLPPMGGPMESLDWPSRMITGAQQVAAAVGALGPERVVLVADHNAPPTFSHTAGAFLGAGLQPAPAPATWPHRLGGLPALPVHAFDRVWHGSSWRATRASVGAGGAHPRVPVVVELRPSAPSAEADG